MIKVTGLRKTKSLPKSGSRTRKPGKRLAVNDERKDQTHRIDAMLDAALEESFPASDPVAITEKS